MRKSKILLFVITLIFTIVSFQNLFAQSSYHGAFENHFFGWYPSARMEAMGKSFVGVGNDPHSYYVNPGAMGTLEGLSLTGGFANPYYLARDAGYNYFSASYKIKNIGVFGISRDYSDWGKVIAINEAGEIYGEYIPNNITYRITYAREVIKDLYIGTNLNMFTFDFDDGRTPKYDYEYGNVFMPDFGVLKRFNIMENKDNGMKMRIDIGSSISNFINSSFTINDHIGAISENISLPVIFRIGASHNLALFLHKTPFNTQFLNILYSIEYQNVLNGNIYNGIKTGIEFSFFEIISLRGGFYSLGLEAQSSCANCKGKIQELTYGAGINLPLKNLGITKIPAEFRFDLAVMPQPSQITNPEDYNFGDYRVFNFTAKIGL